MWTINLFLFGKIQFIIIILQCIFFLGHSYIESLEKYPLETQGICFFVSKLMFSNVSQKWPTNPYCSFQNQTSVWIINMLFLLCVGNRVSPKICSALDNITDSHLLNSLFPFESEPENHNRSKPNLI